MRATRVALLHRITTLIPALAAVKLLIELVGVVYGAFGGTLGAPKAVGVVELAFEGDGLCRVAGFAASSARGASTTKPQCTHLAGGRGRSRTVDLGAPLALCLLVQKAEIVEAASAVDIVFKLCAVHSVGHLLIALLASEAVKVIR